MDRKEIILYEELQCNAFPALQTILYDGWSVRFGGGFTYRVNCANPMYPEMLEVSEKVIHVEQLYREAGLSMAIFKLHDGMAPDRLHQCQMILDERGYITDRDANLFVCDLYNFSFQPQTEVQISEIMSKNWLNGFLTMNDTPDTQRVAAGKMLTNIACPILAASIIKDGKMAACGLGVMERGYVGLYDIYVDNSYRRRGLGSDICAAIMLEGRRRGCQTAYLQVLAENQGARSLYRTLGYSETYRYWFRLKQF